MSASPQDSTAAAPSARRAQADAVPPLVRAVASDVLPRLAQNLRARDRIRDTVVAAPAIGSQDVVTYAHLTVGPDAAPSLDYVTRLRLSGIGPEQIYLELLAPAARLLGDLWADDDMDFMQVTIGTGRMQQALHALSPAFVGAAAARGWGRRALLSAAPGDQHIFGIAMLADFFRREGWYVSGGAAASLSQLQAELAGAWYAVVCLSVSCDEALDGLDAVIACLRAASRNPRLGVLVGGPSFTGRGELALSLGADAAAGEAPHAVREAGRLLDMLPGRDALSGPN